MALPTRADDINVAAWGKLIARINDEAPGWEGAHASLFLTEQVAATTRQMLDAMSEDVFVQWGLQPVRDEFALLESRLDAYRSALTDTAGPVTAQQVDFAEYVRLGLVTGQQKPPLPNLARGDAMTAATLYNQVLHAAVVDAQQNVAIYSITGGDEASRRAAQGWLTKTWHDLLDEAAPGEAPTLRDKAVAVVRDAAADVTNLLQQAGDLLPRLLKWVGIGAGALFVAYLLWRYSQR